MKHSISPEIDFYSDTEAAMLAVGDQRTLEVAASLLDSFEFKALAEHQQLHLCLLYSEAYLKVTGALA